MPTANFNGGKKPEPTPTPDDNLRNFRAARDAHGGVGRTFTVGGDGKVRSSHVPKPDPRMSASMPKPYALNVVAVGSTMCEVDWKVKSDRFTVSRCFQYEFQWRLLSLGGSLGIRGMAMENWQQATKLISQQQVRKKNLKPGGHYEFRVRSVEEMPGGTLGDRSMWSDSLKVMLNSEDFKPQTKPEVAKPEQNKYTTQGQGVPLAGHRHPVHHPTAQASEPSRPRAGGGPLGGAGVTPDLADYLAEEFVESDEEEEMPKEAQSALGQGLGKKKSSQWERVDVEDPLKRTDSIFDKTFYHKVYSMNSTTPAKEISSGEDDDGSDEEEAHEVDDELDLDDNWNEEEEMWFDLHPPKHNMIKYQHEVRSVPSLDGKVIGFLIPGAGVQAKRPKNVKKEEASTQLAASTGCFVAFIRLVERALPPNLCKVPQRALMPWSGAGP